MRMSDLPFFAWVVLGVGGVLILFIFAPAAFWEWVVRRLARRERKSAAELRHDTARQIRRFVSTLCKGTYAGGQ
jgi:hypothetical protein